jgi:RNA polymerase sigma factor (sigma-70 family)
LARLGDDLAVAALYRRHVPRALAYARSLVGCDPDDVVSEAFAGMLTQLSRGAGPDTSVRAYLLQAVRHAYVSEVRKQSRYVTTGDLSSIEQPDPVDDEPAGRLETVAIEFRRLADRERHALWMTIVEGYSLADAGRQLDASEAAVGALVYRARKRLRARLRVRLGAAVVEAGGTEVLVLAG